MILAVLEAHGGLKLGLYDIYLNVAGVSEPTNPPPILLQQPP